MRLAVRGPGALLNLASIAAACGFLYSPPAFWDTVPLPVAQVVEVPMDQLAADCAHYQMEPVHGQLVGCAAPSLWVAFVPTWETWPGTRACWLENKRHERAHLAGWIHP